MFERRLPSFDGAKLLVYVTVPVQQFVPRSDLGWWSRVLLRRRCCRPPLSLLSFQPQQRRVAGMSSVEALSGRSRQQTSQDFRSVSRRWNHFVVVVRQGCQHVLGIAVFGKETPKVLPVVVVVETRRQGTQLVRNANESPNDLRTRARHGTVTVHYALE